MPYTEIKQRLTSKQVASQRGYDPNAAGFIACGSEVYGAVENNRRGVGVELKPSYFKQARLNLEKCEKKTPEKEDQSSLF